MCEAEAFFFIARFLRDCTPFQAAADALERELNGSSVLGHRMTWTGSRVPRTLESMRAQYSNVPGNRLLVVLSRQAELENGTLLVDSKLRARSTLPTPSVAPCEPSSDSSQAQLQHQTTNFRLKPAVAPGGLSWLQHRLMGSCAPSTHLLPDIMRSKFRIPVQFSGHRWFPVCCLLHDKTGRILVSGGDDTLVKVWSADSGRLQVSLRGFSKEINDVTISGDNSMIAAASGDATPAVVRVWSVQTGEPVSVLRGHTGIIRRVAFDPVFNVLVSASDDGSVGVWDIRGAYPVDGNISRKQHGCDLRIIGNRTVIEHTSARDGSPVKVTALDVAPQGGFIATGTEDGSVRVIRTVTEGKSNRKHPQSPRYVLDAAVPMLLPGHMSSVTWLRWSHKGDRLLSICQGDGTIRLWSWDTTGVYQVMLRAGTGEAVAAQAAGPRRGSNINYRFDMCSWSLDDKYIITTQVANVNTRSIAASDVTALEAALQQRTKVWDAVTGALLFVLSGHTQDVVVVNVHPWDPRIVLTAGYDGRIILWNIHTGKPWRRFRLMQVDVDPENDNPVQLLPRVWNTGDVLKYDGPDVETVIGTPANEPVSIYEASFHPNGYSFAVADSNGRVSVFSCGELPLCRETPYEQYLSDDYNGVIMDEAMNVADAVTQRPPHVMYSKQKLINYYAAPYSVSPKRLLPSVMPCPVPPDEVRKLQIRAFNFNKAVCAPVVTVQRRFVSTTTRGTPTQADAVVPPPTRPQLPPAPRTAVPQPAAAPPRNRRQVVMSSDDEPDDEPEEQGPPDSSSQSEESSEFDEDEVSSSDHERDDDDDGQFDDTDSDQPARASTRQSARAAAKKSKSSKSKSTKSKAARVTRSATHSGVAELLDDGIEEDDVPTHLSSKRASDTRSRRRIYDDDSGDTSDLSGVVSDDSEDEGKPRPPPKRRSAPAVRAGSAAAPVTQLVQHATAKAACSRVWLHVSKWSNHVYVPQAGDEVVYFPQGHSQALSGRASKLPAPWSSWPRAWFAVLCTVEKVEYCFPDGEDLLTKGDKAPLIVTVLELKANAVACSEAGSSPWLTQYGGTPVTATFAVELLGELDSPDFLVLKHWYEASMRRNWNVGDKVASPWLMERNVNDEGDTEYALEPYTGVVENVEVVSPDWPTSNWGAVTVRFEGPSGEVTNMSAWELLPPGSTIDDDSSHSAVDGLPAQVKEAMVAFLLRISTEELDPDFWEIGSANKIAVACGTVLMFFEAITPDSSFWLDYGAAVPLPMDLARIQRRLLNGYYRSVASLQADLELVLHNCKTFNLPDSDIVHCAERVIATCQRELQRALENKPPTRTTKSRNGRQNSANSTAAAASSSRDAQKAASQSTRNRRAAKKRVLSDDSDGVDISSESEPEDEDDDDSDTPAARNRRKGANKQRVSRSSSQTSRNVPKSKMKISV